MNGHIELERHPWEPFINTQTRLMFMGTFPPQPHRWSFPFFYPNVINDFWRIMGLLFFGERDHFYLPELKRFDVDAIKKFLTDRHIGMGDTGLEVRRLADNASDKFLEIVTPIPFYDIAATMPFCRDFATTGEKAAQTLADLTSTVAPKMGEFVETTLPSDGRLVRLWRMPSTSRAYPLALDKKAAYYKRIFDFLGML